MMTRFRHARRAGSLAIVALALSASLAACGQPASGAAGHGSFTDAPATRTLEVRTDPSGRLAWERPVYEVAAGDVTFMVSSIAGLAHNFVIQGPDVHAQSPTFAGGTVNRYTLAGLKPGDYQIICTVPGHREAGMVADLRVR